MYWLDIISPPSVGWDAFIIKVNKYGNLEWDNSFGEPLNGDPRKIFDECYGVRSTPDGGYIIACGTGIEPDFWMVLIIGTAGVF